MVKISKVCVVTATRAEYGLLKPLLEQISARPDMRLQLIVTGAHLCAEFGSTWRDIEADGFHIDERCEIVLASDTPTAVCKSMGLAMGGLGEAYARLAPDLVVLLGDRYEMLSAAAAATVHAIPVAHLHGGEITEGAIDDMFRHAITKMSRLHFSSTERYRQRVIQLGEAPDTVFDVGAIGLDAIRECDFMDVAQLGESVGTDLSTGFVLVTVHPETSGQRDHAADADAVMSSLLQFDGLKLLVTGSNADAGGRQINDRMEHWRAREPGRVVFIRSLGQRRYLSALKTCRAVVGNSSSGIIEAPSFAVPTVDIGDRQKGRIRAPSVIHSEIDAASIQAALGRGLSSEFRSSLVGMTSPYGDGRTAHRVVRIIAEHLERPGPPSKSFFDL